MLVVQRKVKQRVMIGDDIIVTICEVKGRTVAVGIEAPKDIPVHREEVYERIKAEK